MVGSLWKEHGPIDGRQVEHVPMAQSQIPDGLRPAAGDLVLLSLLPVQGEGETVEIEGGIDLLVELARGVRDGHVYPLRALGGLDPQ